jgi:catechol 2,3-dioxygenase-like lactoylglutathione lyase family enzyme
MEPGLRYHHIGIPTREKRPNEEYLRDFKVYVSGYDDSPFGVEWLRFEDDSPLPALVKGVPHVAFEVSDLATAIAGRGILIEPNSPSEGVTVAFIVDDGAPIELLEFSRPRGS